MAELKKQTHTFPPEFHSDSRILILGSFPSVMSRNAYFYYGHKQNRFWKILYRIFNSNGFKEDDITNAPDANNINIKKSFLEKNHIALWDVIDECMIEGSSDSSIKEVVPVDILKILNNTCIERIFVNGKTAEKYYKKYLEKICGRTAVCLPSSSPANAAWSLDRLEKEWRKLFFPHIKYIKDTVLNSKKLNHVNPDFYLDKDITDGYLDTSSDIPLIKFHCLEVFDGVDACFTTRLGGVSKGNLSSLNLGFARNDSIENLKKNYSLVSNSFGTNLNSIVMTDQVHSADISYADFEHAIGEECTLKFKSTDGLYTDLKGLTLSATFADCVPVYFFDPKKNLIAMIHSGWKGTVEQISKNTVDNLITHGSNPSDIITIVGPSMSGVFYEVTEDVINRFKDAYDEALWQDIFKQTDKTHYHLDMWAAIYHTLVASGVKTENIHFSGICTYDNADMMFSHRRSMGMRGNMNGFIKLL
ncbi:MAG: peptidoglycan editing factor PgeF [Lachnospiraceae bacterium]|nr:peptidoglycan editing factor PgeF [Lachnospiraceae bacterium]